MKISLVSSDDFDDSDKYNIGIDDFDNCNTSDDGSGKWNACDKFFM